VNVQEHHLQTYPQTAKAQVVFISAAIVVDYSLVALKKWWLEKAFSNIVRAFFIRDEIRAGDKK